MNSKWMQVKELSTIGCIVSPLTAVLACLLLGAILLLLYNTRKCQVPGPARLPLLGNLLLLRYEKQLHIACNKLYKTFGPLFRLQLGSVNAVIITDAALIREVQRKQVFSGRASVMGFTRLVSNGGNSLAFTDTSPSWKFHHKFVHANLFQRSDLQRGERHILKEADILCNDFLQYARSGQPTDCTWNFTVAVTNVVFSMLFGKRLESGDPRLAQWRRASDLLVKSISSGGLLHCMPWLRKFPGFRDQWKLVVKCQEDNWNLMGQFLREAIQPNDSYDSDDQNEPSFASRLVSAAMERNGDIDIDSILDVSYQDALDSKDSHNDPDIMVLRPAHVRSILLDIMGAGSDTTTHTMRWLIALLAKHPDIQRRIQAEIDEAITDEPTTAHRNATPLLSAVIKETMRLYPAAPLSVPHSATADTTLAGYPIAKDTVVLLNLRGMMRDPNVWKKSEAFEPDRFLTTDEVQRKVQEQHFMPFSGGVRSCMGKHLAQMTLFLTAVKLFKSYTIEEVPQEAISLEPLESGEVPIPRPYKVLISRRYPEHF
jgi:cytochrome P450